MPGAVTILTWLHIGDLHVTVENGENIADLRRIVALANGLPDGAAEFTLLPGDNADDGEADQFRLVRDAMAPLGMPVHILPGDHDFKPRNLLAFHQILGARRLPYAETIHGYRCLFLDVVSAGTGGPDFRLGDAQLDWAERELNAAEAEGEQALIFMHTYPADLRAGAEKLGALIARPHVACVDMGHTHYNELANDGATIFMATRSTGQIEEGAAGFSVAAVDAGGVSWRFKTLDQAWPLVLITTPTDRRLATGASPATDGTIRAKILGDAAIASVEAQIDDADWMPMAPVPGMVALWQAYAPSGHTIRVRARDTQGRADSDQVEPRHPGWTAPPRFADGSDRDSVGAWPAKALFDTQLGPNRNGRKW